MFYFDRMNCDKEVHCLDLSVLEKIFIAILHDGKSCIMAQVHRNDEKRVATSNL